MKFDLVSTYGYVLSQFSMWILALQNLQDRWRNRPYVDTKPQGLIFAF